MEKPISAVVVANGQLDGPDRRHVDASDLVVAADGGAATLAGLGVAPAILVGDLDSLPAAATARLADAGTSVERHPADKDASDTELAVARAFDAGAARVTLLGALGGARLDHEVANLLLLADPEWRGRDLALARGAATVRSIHGGQRLTLDGAEGDIVSLLPVGGDADGVRTGGLRYPLDGESLRLGRARGLSNRVVAPPAWVSLERGCLLAIEIAGGDTP